MLKKTGDTIAPILSKGNGLTVCSYWGYIGDPLAYHKPIKPRKSVYQHKNPNNGIR